MGQSQDLNNAIVVDSTMAPNIVTTTTNGATVDLAGYSKFAIVAHIGTIADGTYAFDVEDSPDGTNWTNVAAGLLSGSLANATSSADDRVQEVGYLGKQRYLRCNLTVTGSPSTGGPISVVVIKAGGASPV